MKKYLPMIIIVVALVAIGGYFFLNQKASTTTNTNNTQETKNNIFTSIKDAMSKSLSLKCEYVNEGGKTTTYVKGNLVRVMTAVTDEKGKAGNIILKDNKMWIWNEGEKEGIIFELNPDDLKNQSTNMPNQTNKDKIVEELEKFKEKCSSAVVSDSMFSPPSGIVFQDLTKLQEGLMNQVGIPTTTVESGQ